MRGRATAEHSTVTTGQDSGEVLVSTLPGFAPRSGLRRRYQR
jgi:hypothetical protein